jgi:hypothetical protein
LKHYRAITPVLRSTHEPTITAAGARPHLLQAAQRDVALLKDHVDIVEAGTILCLTEGLNAVRALRAQCRENHRCRLESGRCR